MSNPTRALTTAGNLPEVTLSNKYTSIFLVVVYDTIFANPNQANPPDFSDIWKVILQPGAAEDEQFVRKYYKGRGSLSIQNLVTQPRPWMSWSYRAAYRKLFALLEQASLDYKLRCRVLFEELSVDNDRYQPRNLVYNEAHAPLSVIFDALKTIPATVLEADRPAEKIKGTAHVKKFARILHVTDISPLVLNCIFGTSSSLDMSHIAAFVDRNLNGLNWAKVNLLQLRNTSWSSYIYEYHFSFYYVTLDFFELGTVKPDPRQIRRSCPFGKRKCDTYFKPRYAKETGARFFRSYDPGQSPGQLLLYWIVVALFHARSRWENAIDALDAEMKSPSDVVFMEDRSDLMADDPQFSLSKTYFWALQTYKLFERTLEQTIATWETFKIDSLPKIQDGRISPEDWDAGVSNIEQGIELLKPKIVRIRRGIQDVRDLREGLQSTAAVFDSRTAVRQGENIRLLTYITLLFLPLSFGTGIFSMQFIESNSSTVNAFAITLPIITIVSALVIFNLNALTAAFDSAVRKATFGLRGRMKLHHRKDWKQRALALYQDDISAEPPVRKASKQSSHWVYILFLIETATILLPVSELDAALRFYGIFDSKSECDQDDDDITDKEEARIHRPGNNRRKEVLRRVKRAAQQAEEQEWRRREEDKGTVIVFFRRSYRNSLHVSRALMGIIFNSLRLLLIPIWIVLLCTEYILVLAAFTLLSRSHPHPTQPSPNPPAHAEKSSRSHSSFAHAWRLLGLNTLTVPNRPRLFCPDSSGSSEISTPDNTLPPIHNKGKSPTATKDVALKRPQIAAASPPTSSESHRLRHSTKLTLQLGPENDPKRASSIITREENMSTPSSRSIPQTPPTANVEVRVFDLERSRRTARARLARAANVTSQFDPHDLEGGDI
ncbi:hypothetical protein PAAG_09026 [Paracoccidioides lutzii Pb01]|uniref:Uncharacterized protein n=1 Tax=Paracoccidioides lutzii (strain ATCC MYA-826 / Pb01) TaxID=502779 RepID=C1HE33_PARBA|nr:hypothetical protein PAAG_09026 [Paracoccidioides lutzii Pb01]EEH40573.2 hypothetical protein PAAG_09026 [Paracoccidioides lutzii Pb01]